MNKIFVSPLGHRLLSKFHSLHVFFQLFENIDDAFKYFDTGQNRIKSIDLASALRMANVNPTPQDVRDLLRTLGHPSKFIAHVVNV